MKFLLTRILSVIGPEKLIKLVWQVVRSDLIELAKKSDTKIDDELIKVIDSLIEAL